MSKLKEQAAQYISAAAGFTVRPDEIECVIGYNKRIDCYRFEIVRRDFICGCWETLSVFVRECKKYGGAELLRDGPHYEVYPKYPPSKGDDSEPLPDYVHK